MKRTIQELLQHEAPPAEAPARADLALMNSCLDESGPIVVWLQGAAGLARNALLDAFAESARAREAAVYTIDCHAVEPTEAAFVRALGELLGTRPAAVNEVANILSAEQRPVLVFHGYEVFRLADSWLRRQFIPVLGEQVRLVFVSSESPSAGWLSAHEWRDYFLAIKMSGESSQDQRRLQRDIASELQASGLAKTLDACSVVRRITTPMLECLCEEADAEMLFDQIAEMSFVEQRSDGLAIREDTKAMLSERVRAANLERYRHYQKQAWRLLKNQLRSSPRADLWRYTADIIYLLQNPVIREAFFPSESARHSVEPAGAGDEQAIFEIARTHETDAGVAALRLWWQHMPEAFHVVHDSDGNSVGFYCMAKPDELGADWMQSDPVCRRWLHHLGGTAGAKRAPSILLRRWLSRDDGEAPSAVQAAAWVDIKRTYVELRPHLRRVYLCLEDIAVYAPVATELGFEVLGDLGVAFEDRTVTSAMLDFGPGSVDGWICNLLAAELGIVDTQLVDSSTRELVLDNGRVSLTPLEFKLVSMLDARAGAPVARDELLQQVWGHQHAGSSNVVDALVRGLRKKCGADASVLETVRGVGYRLRQ